MGFSIVVNCAGQGKVRVASCKLRVASCKLRVASCKLQVASCKLLDSKSENLYHNVSLDSNMKTYITPFCCESIYKKN